MSADYPLAVVEEHGARPGLTEFIENIHAVIREVAEECDVPEMEVTVVLTGNITASVRTHSRIEPDFTAERSGGIVRGKTISLLRDYSKTLIVLDTGLMAVAHELDQLELLHLVAHEYGHALIGRLRAVAGTRPPRTDRDKTLEEVAAIFAYETADEFRCDLFSNTLMGHFATVAAGEDGETRPCTLADLLGEGYRDVFGGHLDDVHPGWASIIHSYQTHQLSLDEMFEHLILGTREVLNLIAHADAVEEAGERAPLLTGYEHHPAVQQLLGPVWTPIRKVLDRTPLLPALAEFAAADQAVQDCGQHMVAMWASMGITGHLTEEDRLYISVS